MFFTIIKKVFKYDFNNLKAKKIHYLWHQIKQMKKFYIEIKWGFIYTLAGFLWSFLEKSLGYHDENIKNQFWIGLLFTPIVFLIFYLALKDKKINFLNNEMTWKQGVISGIFVSIVIALLSPISQVLLYNFISPDYFSNMVKLFVENKRMTQTVAQNYFNLDNYMFQNVYFSLSVGVVTSAIVALFVKNKK